MGQASHRHDCRSGDQSLVMMARNAAASLRVPLTTKMRFVRHVFIRRRITDLRRVPARGASVTQERIWPARTAELAGASGG